jgi:LmbE family N-acetylglucosaminyl deacetylase
MACRDGCDLTVLHLTTSHGEMGEARIKEAGEVARRFGYAVASLGIPEGALRVDPPTIERFASVVDRLRPEAILVPFLLDDHAEHRLASLLLAAAWDKSRIASAVEVWAYQVYSALTPNVVVDITSVAADKAEAIRVWRNSAMRQRDWAHFALGRDAFNLRLLDKEPGPHYAEAFVVLPIADYADLCARYARNLETTATGA